MQKIEQFILNDNGKDDRLKILNNGMTKYGCKPYPYNHLSYSSCTASTIDLEAFTYIDNYYNNIDLFNDDIYIEEFQNIRDDLRKIIGLNDDIDICLAPSGTDLELLPYMFFPKNSKILNIVVAPNEVGSGTSLAVKGKVFSNVDNKYNIKKGDLLEGFENFDIDVVNINIRDKSGNIIDEDILINQIEELLKANKDSYKIIHSVFHSKTGLIKPLPEKLFNLKDEKTLIIVDACQFRISREKINELLDNDCIVFVTGSKFFGGPTFSAAAFIPPKLRDIFAFNNNIPKGLNFLFGRELFPKRWKSVNNFRYNKNYELLLRWRVAIFEMQLFNSISQEKIKNTIKVFNNCVTELFREYSSEFLIYSEIYEDEKDYNKLMSNTIMTFGFRNKNIDIEKAKEIYQNLISKDWLNRNFPYSIHLGQPVKIIRKNDRWLGTLRVALSSKFFVNYSGKIENVQKDMIYKELKYIFSAITYIIRLKGF